MKTTFKIVKDTEWDEYQVQVFENGNLNLERTYHTDDQQDAINTFKTMYDEQKKNEAKEQQNRKYSSEKEITAFLRTYRDKGKKVLRLIAYFSKDEDHSEINNIAEFSTKEDGYQIGMFTKGGQLRAHVKHMLKSMFDSGCWIEVEEVCPDYY